MNITLKQIHAFLAVAATLSFSRAAQQVHLSQPALSANIRRLEEIVGARLFDRDTRTVALSSVGAEFLTIATSLLENVDTSLTRIQEFVSGKHGRLTLAVAPSLAIGFLPRVILRFARAYPGIELHLHDVLTDVCIDMVRRGTADLAITPKKKNADELLQRELFNDELALLCSSEHPIAKQRGFRWSDITAHPHIAKKGVSSVRQLVDEEYLRQGVIFRPAFEVEYPGTMLGLIAAGLGIGIVPLSGIQAMNMNNLVFHRFTRATAPYRTICGVTLQMRSATPVVENFLRICNEEVRRATLAPKTKHRKIRPD